MCPLLSLNSPHLPRLYPPLPKKLYQPLPKKIISLFQNPWQTGHPGEHIPTRGDRDTCHKPRCAALAPTPAPLRGRGCSVTTSLKPRS